MEDGSVTYLIAYLVISVVWGLFFVWDFAGGPGLLENPIPELLSYAALVFFIGLLWPVCLAETIWDAFTGGDQAP